MNHYDQRRSSVAESEDTVAAFPTVRLVRSLRILELLAALRTARHTAIGSRGICSTAPEGVAPPPEAEFCARRSIHRRPRCGLLPSWSIHGLLTHSCSHRDP